MKLRVCLTAVLVLIALFGAAIRAEEPDNTVYVYNPDFHGSLLYDQNGGIIGILLNGAEMTKDMIITEKSDDSERVCIKLPGVLAYAWIDNRHLVVNEEEVLDSCLLTGIFNRMMGNGQLYMTPAHPYYTSSNICLNDGDRVTIAGRYGSFYYLPERPPYWCAASDLPIRSNMTPSAKFRNYNSDLLSFRELYFYEMEPDGTEHFNAETALEKAREWVESYYGISLEAMEGKCYLNATHIYGVIGKTWRFSFGDNDDEQYYQGELIDNTGELYYLAQGQDDYNALIYYGYPVESDALQ